MDNKTFARRLGVANSLYQISRKNRWEYLPMLDKLIQMHDRGELKPAEIYFGMATLRQAFDDPMVQGNRKLRDRDSGFADRVYELFGASDPLTGIATDSLRERVQSYAKGPELLAFAVEETARGTLYQDYVGKAEAILTRAYEMAETDPSFGAYWNRFLARDLGGVGLTSEQLFAFNPSLLPLKQALDPGKNEVTPLSAEQLDAALKEHADRVGDQVDKIRQALADYQEPEGRTTIPMLSIERMKAEQKSRQQRAEFDVVAQGLNGIISIFTAFGGDPSTAKSMGTVLTTAVGIRDAYDAYTKSLAVAGSSSLLSAASGLALMGTFVNLAMAFSSSQDDEAEAQFQQTVLESLARMADQIRALHNDVMEGIAHLDARLESGINSVMDGLSILQQSIHENGWRIKVLQESLNNLSQRVWLSGADITRRLDHMAMQHYVDEFSMLRGYRETHGEDIPTAKFKDGLSLVRNFIDTVSNDQYAGLSLGNDDVLAQITAIGSVEDLDEWHRHINTYRSAVALWGQNGRASGRLPNPVMWAYAARHLMYMHANAPSTNIPDVVLASVLSPIEALATESLRLSCADYPEFGGAQKGVTEFLRDSLTNIRDQVKKEVERIHREILLAAGAKSKLLGSWHELEKELSDTDDLLSERFLSDAQLVIKPLKRGDEVGGRSLWFQTPSNLPMPQADSDAMYERFPVLKPSFEEPGSWPDLKITRDIWLSFPEDARTLACQRELLGLGDVCVLYQATVETPYFYDIDSSPTSYQEVWLGYPCVHYCLGTSMHDVFTRLAVSVSPIRHTAHDAVIVLNNPGPRPLNWIAFDFRRHLTQITNSGRPITGNVDVALDAAYESTKAKYRMLARTIHAELESQGKSLDSPLGHALNTLTIVKKFTQGLFTWWYSDLLMTLDNLRYALMGNDIQLFDDFSVLDSGSVRAVPLLDRNTILGLLNSGHGEPEEWTEIHLLLALPELIQSSLSTVLQAHSEASLIPSALRISYPLLTSTYNALADLRELMRLDRGAT